MQEDWNDLRLLAAFAKAPKLTDAARLLGIDPTTLSRRLKAAEARAGAALVVRDGSGAWHLTPEGQARATIAARLATELADLQGTPGQATGVVRLSTVPFLAETCLAPAAPRLVQAAPAVSLELLGQSARASFQRREVDIALRLSRPEEGGHAVRIVKLGDLAYAAAARPGAEDGPWIGYVAEMGHLPHARWLEAGGDVGLRVTDTSAALAAARAGFGPTLVPAPCVDARLRPLDPTPKVTRPLWLMTHRDAEARPEFRAVAAWVREAVHRFLRI